MLDALFCLLNTGTEELIVAALSLLVAVLLGVQFYNALDLQDKLRTSDMEKRYIRNKFEELKADTTNNQIYSKACLEYMQAFTLLFQLDNDGNSRVRTNIEACSDAFLKSLRGFLKSKKATFLEIEAAAKNAIHAAKFSTNNYDSTIREKVVKIILHNYNTDIEGLENLIDEIKKAASQKESGPGA